MKIVYVMDPREKYGYFFRAPEFIARLFCKWANKRQGCWDYAPTEEGY